MTGRGVAEEAFRPDLYRARRPEDTWRVVEPLLSSFGITRIADVTGLDTLRIPVYMAVRPAAKSLSVSQGKGPTAVSAKVSAAMEAIELWHAENEVPDTVYVRARARDIDLPYRVEDLATVPGALVNAGTPLDWVTASGVLSGNVVPVPGDLIGWPTPADYRWSPPGLRWSTNGLASGNTLPEAELHALYEVVERDAIGRQPIDGHPVHIDPASVEGECAALVERVRAAGAHLDIAWLPSRFDVPCFAARIWSEDFPVVSLGWGAHADCEVALSRAITEAAQSRLTGIAGTRDDLPPVYDRMRLGSGRPPGTPAGLVPWATVEQRFRRVALWDVQRELVSLSTVVAAVTGCEPLVVDLSTSEEFAVAKVLVPGTAMDLARVHPGR